MSKDKSASKKVEPTRAQYLYNYPIEDGRNAHITEWLDNQQNKAASLTFLISQFSKQYGSGDIIETVLGQANVPLQIMGQAPQGQEVCENGQ